jgi:thiosulfate/3-mercaptopyruvate sulfurtransferase
MRERTLVSTEWLAQRLHHPDIRIIDVRGQVFSTSVLEPRYLAHHEDYLQSHIPGAVFVDWVDDLMNDPQHMQIAPVEKITGLMQRLNITPDTLVVAYDNAANTIAARLWWTFHYYGHTNVALLDGGWRKWLDEDHPATDDIPQISPADSQRNLTPRNRLRCEGQDVLYSLNGSTKLVDTRSPDEYSGDETMTRLRGHIPGALSLPVDQLLNADGTLLSPDELTQHLASIGIDQTTPHVIFYGNAGVSSCLGIFAMYLLDYASGVNYDGSWLEWGNDPAKPVEMGQMQR